MRTIDALADAGSAVAAAQRSAEERAAEVAALVARSGFADAAEALAAVLDDAERHALARRVAEHDAARTATATGLADPALADLPEAARADVAAARAAVAEAEAVAGAAARQHELVARRAEAARTAAEAVGAAVDGWTVARDAAGPVARMAALASGTGTTRTRSRSRRSCSCNGSRTWSRRRTSASPRCRRAGTSWCAARRARTCGRTSEASR